MKSNTVDKLCIFGVGYVGLPLSIEFSKKFKVIAYDKNKKRIQNLKTGIDINNDLELKEKKKLKNNKNLFFTSKLKDILQCNIYIVTVPTPILKNKKPDLRHVIDASKKISSILKKNDLVIYESTVFPGTTEDICVPILEKAKKFKLNKDFYVGYSPERLSPGDNSHGLKKVVKVTSGSSHKALKITDNLYKNIIKKGTFKASSIKVAEAAKVIENTQRDINIAFINELVYIFDKLKINTNDILKAASTKWNFVKFQPGLVGGHCIAVDPYYLNYISKKKKYFPKLIKPSRDINDKMSFFVTKKILKELNKISKKNDVLNVLILGFAYKENSSDTRNSPIINIYKSLKKNKCEVDVIDPLVNKKEVLNEFYLNINKPLNKLYDCIVLAVPHQLILKNFFKYSKFLKSNKSFVFDIKYSLNNKKLNIIHL